MKAASKKATIAAAAFFCLLALLVSGTASTAAEGQPAVQLSTGITLADTLAALKGKAVTINCVSGQPVTGTVKEAGNGLVHIEKLSGKEFYDALISIDKIVSIEVRVR